MLSTEGRVRGCHAHEVIEGTQWGRLEAGGTVQLGIPVSFPFAFPFPQVGRTSELWRGGKIHRRSPKTLLVVSVSEDPAE